MDAGRYHEHYLLQAGWLAPARHYLFRKAGLARCHRVLDLGCGSGVIAEEMRQVCGRPVLAVDRDKGLVSFARAHYPGNDYLVGDERLLAKKGLRFDLVVLSFVLLWQERPLPFLKRVGKLLADGGTLLLLAEPDYGGRIDYPDELEFLTEIYIGHIRHEGGDPFVGRRLSTLLQQAGYLADVELSSCLDIPRGGADDAWMREWRFWQELAGFNDATLARILRLERNALARQERLVLFPVFCALARLKR